MRRILILLLAGAATPAFAQAGDTAPPAQTPTATAPATTCTPEHAAAGHCTLPAPATSPAAPPATCTAEHAAMGHCTLPAPATQPAPPAKQEPTCLPEHAAMGHCTLPATSAPSSQPDTHAGHDMGQMAGPEVPVGRPPAEALSGPKYAADTVWDRAASERGRNILREEHGGGSFSKVFIDRTETRVRNGRDGYLFDAQAWYGGDIDKLWLKGEVEGDWGRKLEHAEVQALWSHAIGPWFDFQAGARFDPQPGPNRTHLVLGVQGLAPYWWEVEGAVFLSNKGEVTARAEAEYDLRVTKKLILQPRAEVDLSAQDIEDIGIGAGLNEASLGLRLRYQVSPLVAPYIGVEYERVFGDTRNFRRAEGDDPGGLNFLFGLRAWF